MHKSQTSWYQTDVRGSTMMLTGENAQVSSAYQYDAYGSVFGERPVVGVPRPVVPEVARPAVERATEYLYTGSRLDAETGLSDLGFRDYAPALARFTSVDPIRDGRNWFAYVGGDPVNRVDLWGLIGAENAQFSQQLLESLLDQNDPALASIPNMAAGGCNYRSCQAVAELTVGVALTAEQIAESVEANQLAGAVTEDFRVQNPDAIINDAFNRLGAPGTTATVGWGGNAEDPDFTILWGETPNNSNPDGADHARTGDEESVLVFDPYSPDIDSMTQVFPIDVFVHNPPEEQ